MTASPAPAAVPTVENTRYTTEAEQIVEYYTTCPSCEALLSDRGAGAEYTGELEVGETVKCGNCDKEFVVDKDALAMFVERHFSCPKCQHLISDEGGDGIDGVAILHGSTVRCENCGTKVYITRVPMAPNPPKRGALPFSKSTDTPLYDDIMEKPEYYLKEKGLKAKLVYMAPDKYIDMSRRGRLGGKGVSLVEEMRGVSPELVAEYAEAMRTGAKFPIPVLEYRVYRGWLMDDESPPRISISQEGRHRALAAKAANIAEIPVLLVYTMDKGDFEMVRPYLEKFVDKKGNPPGHAENPMGFFPRRPEEAPKEERWYMRCIDCLSVVVILDIYPPKDLKCGACGGSMETMGAVRGTHLIRKGWDVPCSEKCTTATGPKCECVCGAVNHGTGLLVPVERPAGGAPQVKPIDIEKAQQRAAEYRAAKDTARTALDTKFANAIAMYKRSERVPYEEWSDWRWAEEVYSKAKHRRTHSGRIQALKEFVEWLHKPKENPPSEPKFKLGDTVQITVGRRDSGKIRRVLPPDAEHPQYRYMVSPGRGHHILAREEYLTLLHRAEDERKPEPRGPIGTCQVCFRKQRTNGVTLVLHGYHRPGHGYIIGRCTGTNYPPFEVSCEETKKFIGLLQDYHAGRVEHLRKLKADEYDTLPFKPYHARWDRTPPPPIVPIPRGAGWQGVPHAHGSISSYEDLKATLIYNTESEIRHVIADIKTYQKAVDEWKPVPWPPAPTSENPLSKQEIDEISSFRDSYFEEMDSIDVTDKEHPDNLRRFAFLRGRSEEANRIINTYNGKYNEADEITGRKWGVIPDGKNPPEDEPAFGSAFIMPSEEYLPEAAPNPPDTVQIEERQVYSCPPEIEAHLIKDGNRIGHFYYKIYPGHIHLQTIEIETPFRGRGYGTQVLEHMKAVAGRERKHIYGTGEPDIPIHATPQEEDFHYRRLLDFYTKAGFELGTFRIRYYPPGVARENPPEVRKTLFGGYVPASLPDDKSNMMFVIDYGNLTTAILLHEGMVGPKIKQYGNQGTAMVKKIAMTRTGTLTVQYDDTEPITYKRWAYFYMDNIPGHPNQRNAARFAMQMMKRDTHGRDKREILYIDNFGKVAQYNREELANPPVENPRREKYYANSEDDGTFSVYAAFKRSASDAQLREAESWLDSSGSNLAREMGSVHEDRASSSGCSWNFKTADAANAFGRQLNAKAPPCVIILRGEKNPTVENPKHIDSYVLWGTKKGDPKWAEQVIVDTKDKSKLRAATEWAKKNGFVNLRVSGLDMSEAPDFLTACGISKVKNPGLEVRKTGRYIRERKRPPGDFKKGSFVTIESDDGKHKIVQGVLKDETRKTDDGRLVLTTQSILHPLSEEKKLEQRKGVEVQHKK